MGERADKSHGEQGAAIKVIGDQVHLFKIKQVQGETQMQWM